MKREEKKENEKEIRIGANKRRDFGGKTKEKKEERARKEERKKIDRERKKGGEKKRGVFPTF